MNLLEETTQLYWSFGEYGIDDKRRMKAVLHEVAKQIRTWAPRKEDAKICYLAINEVADRILRECETDSPH